MALLNLSAPATWAAPTLDLALNNTDRPVIDAVVGWLPPVLDLRVDKLEKLDLEVDATWAAPAPDLFLELNTEEGLFIEASWSAPTLTTDIQTVVDGAVYDLPPYVEIQDHRLLGAFKIAPGPGMAAVVACHDAQTLAFVHHRDIMDLTLKAVVNLPSRPVALGTTRIMPPIAEDDGFIFVALSGIERADTPPVLQAYTMAFDAQLLAQVELPRGWQPVAIWASNREVDEADFIVVLGGDGRLELRKADATLELLDAFETGMHLPAVVDCVRRVDLEQEPRGNLVAERIWHIAVFDHTGAQGEVFEYREQTTSQQYNGPNTRLSLDLQLPAWGAQLDLFIIEQYLAVEAGWPLPTVQIDLETLNDVEVEGSWRNVTLEANLNILETLEADIEAAWAVPAVEMALEGEGDLNLAIEATWQTVTRGLSFDAEIEASWPAVTATIEAEHI